MSYSSRKHRRGGSVITVPGAPTGLTLGVATSTAQPLTWTAPVSTGGSAITDYLVEYKASASGIWLVFADGVSTLTSATVTGLLASTSYDYRISAINAAGTGPASGTATGNTAAGGSASLTVNWKLPVFMEDGSAIGTITDQKVYYDTVSRMGSGVAYSQSASVGNGSAETFNIPGLSLGQTYYVALTSIVGGVESNLGVETSGVAA